MRSAWRDKPSKLMGAKRWSNNKPQNTAELRKAVAKKMIAEGRYCY